MDDEQFRQRSCVGKKRYRTWAIAQDAAAEVKLCQGVELNIYRCAFCDGHHVTKADGETMEAISSQARAQTAVALRGKPPRRPQT